MTEPPTAEPARPGRWAPWSVDQVTVLFRGMAAPWWLAGGNAIDLHLSRRTRDHGDIDVLVLRRDQLAVRDHLAGWDVHMADPPGTLRPWPVGEMLPDHAHDVWCRPEPSAPWALQLMLDRAEADVWVYRRDARVRRPLADLDGPASTVQRRVLTPEVQLLYKSKTPRPKDDADFEACLPCLSDVQRRWLSDALHLTAPEHAWLPRLDAAG
jgi:hypothetical protein